MGGVPATPDEPIQDGHAKLAPVVLNLSVVLPYMQYRKKLRYFNGMYTPSNQYRLLLLLLLIFLLWTFQSAFFKRTKSSYNFGVVLSLSYSFPAGWAPAALTTVLLNCLTYAVMLVIVVLVAVHANSNDPSMQALAIICVVLFAVVLSRHSRVPDIDSAADSKASGSSFLTQDFVMQVFVWIALAHMALLATLRWLMPALLLRNWSLVRCKVSERRDLADPAAVASLIDFPPGYSLAPERRVVAAYVQYITPWWAPMLGHYESITYVGEVDEAGHPSGYGEWRDTHWHGEHLTGFWHAGLPTGPFRSRETGSASGFVNLRIAYFRNRGEALRKAACLPRLEPLQFGIVACEVSTSGAWFRSLPRLTELLPPVDIADGLIAEEEAAIQEGRIAPDVSFYDRDRDRDRQAARSQVFHGAAAAPPRWSDGGGTIFRRMTDDGDATRRELVRPPVYVVAAAAAAAAAADGGPPRSRQRAASYTAASVAIQLARAPMTQPPGRARMRSMERANAGVGGRGGGDALVSTVREEGEEAAEAAASGSAAADAADVASRTLSGFAQAERMLRAPSLHSAATAGAGAPPQAPLTTADAATAVAEAAPTSSTSVFFQGVGRNVPRLVSMLMPLQPSQTTKVRGGERLRPRLKDAARGPQTAAEGGSTRQSWRLRLTVAAQSGTPTKHGASRRARYGTPAAAARLRRVSAGHGAISPAAAASGTGGAVAADDSLGPVHHRALVSFIRSSQLFVPQGAGADGNGRAGPVGGSGGGGSEGGSSLRNAEFARLATPTRGSGSGSGSSRFKLLRVSRGRRGAEPPSPSPSPTPSGAAVGRGGEVLAAAEGGRVAAALHLASPRAPPRSTFGLNRPPEALVFVHGLGVDMHTALRHYAQMMALMAFPPHITPVLFSWPSSVPVAYFWARYRGAEPPETGLALAATVRSLAADGFAGLHILVHSMGTRVLNNALPHLEAILGPAAGEAAGGEAESGGAGQPPLGQQREQQQGGCGDGGVGRMRLRTVTICNPDFGLRRFVEDMGPRLRALCPHVTLYGDKADGALALSEVVNALARPFVGASAALASAATAVPELAATAASTVQARAKSAAALVLGGAVELVRPPLGAAAEDDAPPPPPPLSLPPQNPPPPSLLGPKGHPGSAQVRHLSASSSSAAAASTSLPQQQQSQSQSQPHREALLSGCGSGDGANVTLVCEPHGGGPGERRQKPSDSGGGGDDADGRMKHPSVALCDTPTASAPAAASPAAAVVGLQGWAHPPASPVAPPPTPPLLPLTGEPGRQATAPQRLPAPQAAQLEVADADAAGGDADEAGQPSGRSGGGRSTACVGSGSGVPAERPMGPDVDGGCDDKPGGGGCDDKPGGSCCDDKPGDGGCGVADAEIGWWRERVVNYRRRLRVPMPMLYGWLEHSLGRRIYQVQDPRPTKKLDIDVIDVSYLSSNVNSIRHTHFALNREILDDLWEVIVLGRRASERSSRLEHVTGNVFSIAVAPSFISTRQL
ncbi:hypothetical protein PLESTB_000067100 [Pleodorina starrii]|uniref:Uncharacterized protein n=1 Tax=Pleodorina starrii TaxID=330485 RepID=A0A9W6BAW1_9CHLO|nr:hypothetical protein PLESTM_001606000 [Pleodorina starrii]GLC48171.1 hypothetical protein PLESTB_000067100 [Pleodorina starrii]GLC67418.1 hypothetical protein PLESTF_000554100 [Pleodorina starrii]